MEKEKIKEIKDKIEYIKEYVTSDLCKKCEEMYQSLIECQKLLDDLKNKNENERS
jgi:hypothetical protein